MKVDTDALYTAMANKKLTYTVLAELAGTTRQTLCNIRRGTQPAPITLGRIADALGIDVTDLVMKEDSTRS